MSPDKCSTRYCRGEVHVIHLGEGLCEKCWDALCAKDHETHKIKTEKVAIGSGDSEETRKALMEIVKVLNSL